jgi:hypothetical protein
MPGMNGKGPLRKGPLSGGQRGVCNQIETDKTGQPQGAPVDVVPGQGRGLGRCQGGAGRGAGKGQVRGQGRSGNR